MNINDRSHRSSRVRSVLALALLVCGFGEARAQTVFRIFANGAQGRQPTPSLETGDGLIFLDPATGFIRYRIEATGVTGSFIMAHLHIAPPGLNGPIEVRLSGGPLLFTGTANLTPAATDALQGGDFYFNLHTGAYPGGEIRGQAVAALTHFALLADGDEVVPPTASTGNASGSFEVHADRTVSYQVDFQGLGSAVTSATLHRGKPGDTGVGVQPLQLTTPAGTSGTFAGTLTALNDKDTARFRAGHMYVEIASTGLPAGEIRGQVAAAFSTYGVPCGGSARLEGSGLPTPGGSIELTVAGGTPGAAPGVLLAGFQGSDLLFPNGCHLYTGTMQALFPVPALDGAGAATVASSVPASLAPLAGTLGIQVQYFGADPAQLGGFFASNGLSVLIDD